MVAMALCVADIDACTNNACDNDATCADSAAPALDNAAGRTCTCNAGFSGTGETGNCAGTPALGVATHTHSCPSSALWVATRDTVGVKLQISCHAMP